MATKSTWILAALATAALLAGVEPARAGLAARPAAAETSDPANAAANDRGDATATVATLTAPRAAEEGGSTAIAHRAEAGHAGRAPSVKHRPRQSDHAARRTVSYTPAARAVRFTWPCHGRRYY